MTTRVYQSGLLKEATRLQIVARDETRRGVILNGLGYWITKTDAVTYTIRGENKAEGYTVTADDMGGRCTCPAGKYHKHRVCKHCVCVAVLRQDRSAMEALKVKEVL
jgi:hypothetical protein